MCEILKTLDLSREILLLAEQLGFASGIPRGWPHVGLEVLKSIRQSNFGHKVRVSRLVDLDVNNFLWFFRFVLDRRYVHTTIISIIIITLRSCLSSFLYRLVITRRFRLRHSRCLGWFGGLRSGSLGFGFGFGFGFG